MSARACRAYSTLPSSGCRSFDRIRADGECGDGDAAHRGCAIVLDGSFRMAIGEGEAGVSPPATVNYHPTRRIEWTPFSKMLSPIGAIFGFRLISSAIISANHMRVSGDLDNS